MCSVKCPLGFQTNIATWKKRNKLIDFFLGAKFQKNHRHYPMIDKTCMNELILSVLVHCRAGGTPVRFIITEMTILCLVVA
jgi:hypothetical protein